MRSKRVVGLALVSVSLLPLACSDAGAGDAASARSAHAENVDALTDVLPADTRGVLAVDVAGLRSVGSSEDASAWLEAEGADPALTEALGSIGSLAASIDVAGEMTSALVAQTTDPADGSMLIAKLRSDTIDEVVSGPRPRSAGTHGAKARPLFVDEAGNHLALLPGGLLVAGKKPAVTSVLDVADGSKPEGRSAIAPFLDAVDATAPISFAYGLPALFDDAVTPDRTLRGAAVMSGSFAVADGDLTGSLAFHTSNAKEFVEAYNTLNRNAVQGDDPSEEPLTLAAPVAEGLDQVVVPLPPMPIDASPEQVVASRNIFKKLFVGMEAHDYAEGVSDAGNAALVDLLVKSEEDEDTPPSPGSVFIRWEFRDQAAIEKFEADVLPEGFTLARTRFLEGDDPEGGYFLALNLYNSSGSIVSGARAEWDVFVNPPKGADPDAGQRPRFMIIDALAATVSADPLHLVTPAEPLSHTFVDDSVVTSIRRREGASEVPVFASSFPKPDPAQAEVARFTREMAIGNDYIYWSNGVYDRVLYNATTFNYDAYFVDPSQVTISDDSRWAQYLNPEVKDLVYYVNTLEYVASPMANLDSDHLDVTPEWLADLTEFKNNGHQTGLMRGAVDQLFRGEGDALVAQRVGNDTPSTYFNFEITDPEALEAALDLPPGTSLAPTTLVEGEPEAHYLTLSVLEVDDAIEGTRAEWSVYVDDGNGRPHQMIVDLMTEDAALDPVSIVNLPSEVRHDLDEGVLHTQLASDAISFDASFDTAGATDEELTLDWIETGDTVCHLNGICDEFFYDAETLDVPVHQPADVTVEEFSTPWDEFVSAEPALVFYRDNAQEYAVKRWQNLKVVVDEAPVGGLEDRTHTISGSGALVGRTSDVVSSDYTYTGDAKVEGDELTFSLDQQIENQLGVAHIYTTGTFDLSTGEGTQTVVDCRGPDLLCSDISRGATALYTAQELDAGDPDAIEWQVKVSIDLGSFGIADSASTFVATREK